MGVPHENLEGDPTTHRIVTTKGGVMRLDRKVAIVTGSSSGIGRAIAIRFAQEGAKVAVTGRNAERLAEVEKTINTLKINKNQLFKKYLKRIGLIEKAEEYRKNLIKKLKS